MNGKVLIAVAAVAVLIAASVAAVFFVGGGDSNDKNSNVFSAAVWLVDGDVKSEYEGSGSTMKNIIQDAVSDHTVSFSSNGNVSSVDGKGNTGSRTWAIFKWASPNGWEIFSDKSSSYIDGMSIALCYSGRTTDEKGVISYSVPDIDIEYKVYFFLQFKEEQNSTEWMKELNLSDSQKISGIWIEGTGNTTNAALADAVIKYLFPRSENSFREDDGSIVYTLDGKEGLFTYGSRSGMYGWFLSFFGWSDTKVGSGGEYGTWTYWSQYNYHPSAKTLDDPKQWNYNQLAFGMYDITKYRYFGLVLQTSAAEDDVDAELPAPSKILRGL
jgi:hypothetical protein